MADDKKNIPEAAPPAEAPAPAVENAVVPEQPAPEPVLTDAEAVMLEHEEQAALFEMGEAVPDPADAVTHAEVEKPAAPEVPKAEKERAQPPTPGKDAPAPAHSGKVVDFAAARDEAAKEEKKAVKQKPPTEKAQSLKMQVEAIKHQGSRPGEEDKDAGKRSTQVVGDRNGMNYKQVQRYIRLPELVPDLQKMVDEKKLAFTPAVEISFIRPKNQRYIAVSIEGQQSSSSLSQAQKIRELDKDGKLNGDVIDGILSQEKKEVGKVIINSAELEKYFGKDKSPREMKDKIISLLDDWKAKQPPELGKPEKKTDLEKWGCRIK